MSLLEVVVALMLLSVVLMALTGIMWQMGRLARVATVIDARGSAVESAASLAEAFAWDSLDALVGCSTDSSALLPFTRCFEVSAPSAGIRQVRVIVIPLGAVLRPDTITVSRTRPRSRSPLYAP